MLYRICLIAVLSVCGIAHGADISANPYVKWENGPSHDAGFFAIAVWLQSPSRAREYIDAGFNTYIGLWRGPTEEQLAQLKAAGMKVICGQNEIALKHLDDPTIIGWMHGDEPDNAQPLRDGKGYGPPIPPQKIVDDYLKIRQADPTRPVVLNLGQGVAWDGWFGRGVRTNHPEDYPKYIKGSDIVSFDIYPACHDNAEVAGNLWYVPKGVERLVQWTQGKQPVWTCIECTQIQHPTTKATPHEVRCEVWMALIHGSKGLIYFVHEWKPKFNEAALLSDSQMREAVTAINRQITELAPVLNSPATTVVTNVLSDNKAVPIATMLKKHAGATYLFAVAMRKGQAAATFTIQGLAGEKTVEVLGENRTLNSKNGIFKDEFQPWDVHLYRIQ